MGHRTTSQDARRILGVSHEAGDAEIRAAYLCKVKQHPPDRSPDEFEGIRDAYQLLKDPHRRIEQMLLAADPGASFASLLDESEASLQYVGPEAWLRAMRRK